MYNKTTQCGTDLLNNPRLNKGTAFSQREREQLGLLGLLPPKIETIEEQLMRTHAQFLACPDKMQQSLMLYDLYNTNETLFYKLAATNIAEILPIIYTPYVAQTVQNFSQHFHKPRGLYLSYQDHAQLNDILNQQLSSDPNIDLIVVTDGEGVLGIGDQGIGSIHIPIAKSMLYTLFGGIDPARILPIVLDVGTNNTALLDDPLYLGWRHPRIANTAYATFIDDFVNVITKQHRHIFLHWEDFGRDNAALNLAKFRDHICSFNDDIQGTAVVTLAAILAALKTSEQNLQEQRIVIFGAGTAGTGIAEHICTAMQRNGIPRNIAQQKFWLLDKNGLLTNESSSVTTCQKPYLRNSAELQNWNLLDSNNITILDVVKNIKPTILIGCSTLGGAFTRKIVEEMAKYANTPIIFPLSNPSNKCEALPSDLLTWTKGKCIVATGSPFAPVTFAGKQIKIAQCNNALAFPGIGLGMQIAKPSKLTDDMLWAATEALLSLTTTNALLPDIANAAHAAIIIAKAIIIQAQKEGQTTIDHNVDLDELIQQYIWPPKYHQF